MDYLQRMAAKVIFQEKLAELSGSAFERFFHNLMCARYPDFLDIRTDGRLGDQGADGLLLHTGRLYACYAPETYSAYHVESKFTSDLAKAIEKRSGQFNIFVFVHNDLRGIRPQISSMITNAAAKHDGIGFEAMGWRGLWLEIMRLDREQVEDLLGSQIPIGERVFRVGMEDLAPLLKQLSENRVIANQFGELGEVSAQKLEYNKFDEESRRSIIDALGRTHLVEKYYAGVLDAQELDEVAAGFKVYYEQMRAEWDEPEDILWQLGMYILGNASPRPQMHRAALVILAYFFERCDIFEPPPFGWVRTEYLEEPG